MAYYGMFSDLGNELVHEIVLNAQRNNLDWDTVMEDLEDLTRNKDFAEATDTDVREQVWVALYGWTKQA